MKRKVLKIQKQEKEEEHGPGENMGMKEDERSNEKKDRR